MKEAITAYADASRVWLYNVTISISVWYRNFSI